MGYVILFENYLVRQTDTQPTRCSSWTTKWLVKRWSDLLFFCVLLKEMYLCITPVCLFLVFLIPIFIIVSFVF